jgi:hypothetical protein
MISVSEGVGDQFDSNGHVRFFFFVSDPGGAAFGATSIFFLKMTDYTLNACMFECGDIRAVSTDSAGFPGAYAEKYLTPTSVSSSPQILLASA